MAIQSQNLIGVTSSFTKSEYLAVLKETLANQTRALPSQNTITSTMQQFDNFIQSMGIEYFETDTLTNNTFFQDANTRVETSIPVKKFNGDWKGLNGADSLVLVCAERTGSDQIATMDSGFKGITSNVRPLIVREVY